MADKYATENKENEANGNDHGARVLFYEGWDYNIKPAGMSFHQANIAELYPKKWADLNTQVVPEPDNKYDPNAIAIHIDGLHVGYIPKIIASVMAEQMRNGAKFEAAVIYITRGAGTKKYQSLKIALNRS